jgi:hypothetical protein
MSRAIPRMLALFACALCGCDGVDKEKITQDYPTYRALHESTVVPICGPRGGVCHNSKQFPDLHTPDNMLAVVGARCNELTDDPRAIQDLCEPQGDLLLIKSGPDAGFKTRVGFVTTDGSSPVQAITITTHDAVPHDGANLDFSIVRDTDPQNPVELHIGAHLGTHAGQASVVVAGMTSLSMGLNYFLTSPYMPGFTGQLALGDPNQNGAFGFDLGGALIKPGDPQKSFLVQRILGIVPPKMPLANGPLTDDQIYAIQCWIKQLRPDGSNADGPIDYNQCPASF